MSNARITSAEVARRAGVSQSAVSRVFTPGASASKTTIDRVKKAATELGYRPNSPSLVTWCPVKVGLSAWSWLTLEINFILKRLNV